MDWFQEYKPMTSLIVYMGDDIERQVASVGIVLIQLSPSQITKVTNVIHVPTLKKNLLYVSKTMNKKHSSMEFFGNYCVIKLMDQNGKFNLFSIANKKAIFNHLALVWHVQPTHLMLHMVFFAITKAPTLQSILCHHCLWHLHLHAIKQMQNSQLVTRIGGAITSHPICKGCILGKHHVSNFPSTTNPCSTKLLELVHMDLCGPVQTSTHGGAKPFVVFINEYS